MHERSNAILQKTVTTNVLKHKREANDGTKAPRYYVSENHEPIISRDVFMTVKAEMQRRSNFTNPNGKKIGYNARNTLGGVMVCASCGSPFRRNVWSIHGRKEVVWRCRNRVENGSKGCNARSIKEADLQDAIVSALNSCICDKEEILAELKETMRTTVENSNATEIEQLAANMKKLQKKIISMPEGPEQEQTGEEIRQLREQITELRNDDVDNEAGRKHIDEMMAFLKKGNCQLKAYEDVLVRKFIESITVYDYSISIKLKTGREISMQV